MRSDAKTPKRGRPVDETKRDAILDVATKLFMAKGFHATSMDDIAHDAGMSKLTLYRRFPDKQSLFRAVVERKCQASLPEDLYERIKGQKPQQVIHGFCHAFFGLIMSEDAINLYRMMMGEAAQSPDMTKMFFDAGPQRVKNMLGEMFADFKAKGYFKGKDIAEARHTLLSLFTGSELYMKALLNIGKKPSKKEIDQFVSSTADFFINSYLIAR
jgi:TetR/AcrR family transcriptional repressor of mexJK operon